MSTSPVVREPAVAPSVTPHLVISVLGFIVAEAVSYGILNSGTSQVIISIGGIVIPAAWAIAAALHLGHVHAAQIQNERAATKL